MTHTKGKLKVGNDYNIEDMEGSLVFDCYGTTQEECVANAEHLVKCWNNHDWLVEVLKKAIQEIETRNPHPREVAIYRVLSMLKTALAKLEE